MTWWDDMLKDRVEQFSGWQSLNFFSSKLLISFSTLTTLQKLTDDGEKNIFQTGQQADFILQFRQ